MPVRQTVERALAEATRVAVALRDALPADRKEGTRWKFVGLRGPIEEALIDLAAAETEAQGVEKSWELVDAIFTALAKIDRNRTSRSRKMRFELLPSPWAVRLFAGHPPNREARLALGATSLRWHSGTVAQFLAYRLGVIGNGRLWSVPEAVPARRVWGGANLVEDLCSVCQRRLVEFGVRGNENESPPFDTWIQIGLADVHAWLIGDVDEAQLRLWLDRLSLFYWNSETASAMRAALPHTSLLSADGPLALYGFFRPLFDGAVFKRILRVSGAQERSPAAGPLGRIVALLQQGNVDAAADVARGVYHSAGVVLADFRAGFNTADPARLVASLIFPASTPQIIPTFERWQAPTKAQPRET